MCIDSNNEHDREEPPLEWWESPEIDEDPNEFSPTPVADPFCWGDL
jgi:hypothetical protein